MISGTDRVRMKKWYKKSRRRGNKKRRANWIGHILHRNYLQNTLFKER